MAQRYVSFQRRYMSLQVQGQPLAVGRGCVKVSRAPSKGKEFTLHGDG